MKKQVRIITKSGGQFIVFLEEEQVLQLQENLENPAKVNAFFLLPPSGKGEEIRVRFDAIDAIIISPVSNIKMPMMIVPGGGIA